MATNQYFNQTVRTIDSLLSNKAGDALASIDNPVMRNAAGSLVNAFLPGFGGGAYNYNQDSVYRDAVNNRIGQIRAQTQIVGGSASVTSDQNSDLAVSFDWRARLRPKNGGMASFYSSETVNTPNLLGPLEEAGGLVWQYTPNILLAGSAEYASTKMHGANYPINSFVNSQPPDIALNSDFTANDQYEARYLLAVMAFLRICTKAHYGEDSVARGKFGIPPPVLLFEYLGDHGFNKVPVVVSAWSMSFPDDVDYVPVAIGTTTTYVPIKTSINITLIPSYTPHKLRSRFSLEAVTNGSAYKDGFI